MPSIFTLNNIASDKTNTAAKRGDAIRVQLSAIKVVDGFNVRISDDELREHIAAIAGAISVGLPIPPVEVWVNPENGEIELVDGHCRVQAYGVYAETATDFDGYVSAVKFEGNPFQRKMRIASSNKQLKLKPIELGKLYLHARDELGASRTAIAAEAGMSLAHVDQHILLASGAEEVHQAVESGEISATEAVKLVRDHGSDAPAELERRKEVAAEQGRGKVTAKSAAPKPPSRPRVDMVVSNAVVLVNGLGKAFEDSISNGESPEFVEVKADAIADLIMAVREMQQAGKPLDADRQVEMEIG